MNSIEKSKVRKYIYGLFLNDSIGYILIVAILLTSSSLSYLLFVPAMILLLPWSLFLYIGKRRKSAVYKTDSYRITYTLTRGALLSGAIGAVFSIVYLILSSVFDIHFKSYKMLLYFIMLYIVPSILLIANWQNRNANKSIFNMYTTLRYGHIFERSFLGQYTFFNDIRVIKNILRASSLLLFLLWGYYLLIFQNWNINSQDSIIFITVPLVVFILGVIDTGLAANYKHNNIKSALEGDNKNNKSLHKVDNLCVRAMLVCGNKIYLNIFDKHFDQGLHIDISTKDKKYNVKNIDLSDVFGINKIAHKFPLYNNEDIILVSKVKRYVIFVDSPDMVKPREGCEWVDVDDIPYCGTMTEHFKFEWLRVLTFLSVHAVYNADGRLKDKNKKYFEEIRLMDIVDKNIDFNDVEIMKLSIFNCNRSFYRFKRAWFTNVEGFLN